MFISRINNVLNFFFENVDSSGYSNVILTNVVPWEYESRAFCKGLLRLLIATESRQQNLLWLVNFILKIYAEMWFRKQYIPKVQNGLVNPFFLLSVVQDFVDSRISFAVIIIVFPSFHSRKKNHFFWYLFMIGDLKILFQCPQNLQQHSKQCIFMNST